MGTRPQQQQQQKSCMLSFLFARLCMNFTTQYSVLQFLSCVFFVFLLCSLPLYSVSFNAIGTCISCLNLERSYLIRLFYHFSCLFVFDPIKCMCLGECAVLLFELVFFCLAPVTRALTLTIVNIMLNT